MVCGILALLVYFDIGVVAREFLVLLVRGKLKWVIPILDYGMHCLISSAAGDTVISTAHSSAA
jgi:hypothetical protein